MALLQPREGPKESHRSSCRRHRPEGLPGAAVQVPEVTVDRLELDAVTADLPLVVLVARTAPAPCRLHARRKVNRRPLVVPRGAKLSDVGSTVIRR